MEHRPRAVTATQSPENESENATIETTGLVAQNRNATKDKNGLDTATAKWPASPGTYPSPPWTSLPDARTS